MKCTNCGTEFEGNFCPSCGKSAERPIMNPEPQRQTAADNQYSTGAWQERPPMMDFDLPDPEPPEPEKKKPVRLVIEIAGGLLLLVFMFSSLVKVSRSDYKQLEDEYHSISAKAEQYETEITELKKVEGEYTEYKKRMEPYEGLEASEAEARKIEADKIAAEKKAEEDKKKAEEEKKAADAKAAQEEADRKAKESATMEQKNALNKAASYLEYTAFSYTGLIEQLEYEGFSTEASTYAVDNCGADWNEQAAKKAQSYLDYTSFSREGLIEQLIYEGFSAEQAEYGVSAVGY